MKSLEHLRTYPICACNLLLDGITRKHFGEAFDEEGNHAAAGKVRPDLRESLVALLRQQSRMGRSLGTGDELWSWIDDHSGTCRAGDLLRSACEALAIVISGAIDEVATEHGLDPMNRMLLAPD